jgi:hypothetical protein
MAELKTKKTEQSVDSFLNGVADGKKRQDSLTILDVMKDATGAEPKMWGDSIIGFGDYHYKYATGRENDWFLAGFSPRKQNITLYLVTGFEQFSDLMQKLGKYKTGKACLYIQQIEDIDLEVLKELVKRSIRQMKKE